eukprot:TRINITY_DN2063_c0_g1_i2.p1 TRINITY_DN2063_c0_g1~~TRINITY_DN2063_c0_g1_i2.p1  ORF type:complete len:217 (-),score=48.56 TRINITY_DN2063_c0_g1_i2:227-877(-)
MSEGFNFSTFLDDLKGSVYAKIWAVLLIVSVIITFIMVVQIGGLAAFNHNHETWRIWSSDQSETGVVYPYFVIMTQDKLVKYKTIACSFNNSKITLDTCPDSVVTDGDCKMLISGDTRAFPTVDTLTCVITLDVDGDATGVNTALKVTILQGKKSEKKGAFAAYVDPDDDVAITLRQEIYENLGVVWNEKVVYYTDVSEPDAILVNFVMESFITTS